MEMSIQFVNEPGAVMAKVVRMGGKRLASNSIANRDEVRAHWMLRYIPCNLPEYIITFDGKAERIHPPTYCICMFPVVCELNRVGAKYGVQFYIAGNYITKKLNGVRIGLNRGLAQLLLANFGSDPFELLKFVESGSCMMPLPYRLDLHLVGRSGIDNIWTSIPYEMRYEPGLIRARAISPWMRDLHLVLNGMVIT